jgi:hypothetical protein
LRERSKKKCSRCAPLRSIARRVGRGTPGAAAQQKKSRRRAAQPTEKEKKKKNAAYAKGITIQKKDDFKLKR